MDSGNWALPPVARDGSASFHASMTGRALRAGAGDGETEKARAAELDMDEGAAGCDALEKTWAESSEVTTAPNRRRSTSERTMRCRTSATTKAGGLPGAFDEPTVLGGA